MHLPPLIYDLAVILAVAGVVTVLFQRIKQPVVLGYVVAGLIVGPHTPPYSFVTDLPNIHTLAELGIIFLMFTLGLEFSFRKLARVGPSSGFAALFEVSFMFGSGYLVGWAMDWPRSDSIVFGTIVSISSTTVIVKALDELQLKARRFAELVFGILIVEDLIAILMLVLLPSIISSGDFSGIMLVRSTGKLALVIGSWFIAGYFIVPRFIRWVGRFRSNEVMTILALALCLGLVAIAASFDYSTALGAFVMGSILAESTESRRIQELMQPLRDVFAAIFFVSVGMLIDPEAIWAHIGLVLLGAGLVISGKIFAATLGLLTTGQTLKTSLLAGFSLGQIGEFSFILAGLGLTLGLANNFLYPVAVAVSIVTTFTTPYLIRLAPKVANAIDRRLPPAAKDFLARYVTWREREAAQRARRPELNRAITRWIINGFVVTVAHVAVTEYGVRLLESHIPGKMWAGIAGWGIAILLSAPFIWGMLASGWKNARVTTVIWLGLLGTGFLEGTGLFVVTLIVGATAGGLAFTQFYRHLEKSYQWFETGFLSAFRTQQKTSKKQDIFRRLAPWDGHLVRLKVHADSAISGHQLKEVELRKKFGVNVVAIQRGSKTIVTPKPGQQIFPKDELLILGTDEHIDRVRPLIERPPLDRESLPQESTTIQGYELRSLLVTASSPLASKTIRDSGIMEKFECLVVGIERENKRVMNPDSDLGIHPEDLLWVVGESSQIDALAASAAPEPSADTALEH